jgi:hypothetical protein
MILGWSFVKPESAHQSQKGLAGRGHQVQIYPTCSGFIQANCRKLSFSDIITQEFGHRACTFWSLVLPRYTIGSLCFSWTIVHRPSKSATPSCEPPHPSPWPGRCLLLSRFSRIKLGAPDFIIVFSLNIYWRTTMEGYSTIQYKLGQNNQRQVNYSITIYHVS